MKLLLSNNFNITANTVTATNISGDGSGLTGVGASLPFYVWSGYINLENLTLTKVYGDDYFGTLLVSDTTGSATGYRITSDQGAIFTSGKTILPNFTYFDQLNRSAIYYVSVQVVYPSTSIIQLNINGVVSGVWTVFGGSSFQDAAIEIKVYK